MKFATMFGDISAALFHKPVTERYPFERHPVPQRLRGALVWTPENCSGCGLCALDCPSRALELTILDRKAKRFVLAYHLDRCTFCAQCVYSCRQGSLAMQPEVWELAGFRRETFLQHFGDTADVDLVLAGRAPTGPEPEA